MILIVLGLIVVSFLLAHFDTETDNYFGFGFMTIASWLILFGLFVIGVYELLFFIVEHA